VLSQICPKFYRGRGRQLYKRGNATGKTYRVREKLARGTIHELNSIVIIGVIDHRGLLLGAVFFNTFVNESSGSLAAW
jgi:hypothetical protein